MINLAKVYANGRMAVETRFPWLVGDDPLGHSDKEYVDTTIALDIEQGVLMGEWRNMHECTVLCEIGTDEDDKAAVLFLAESEPPMAFHVELEVVRSRPLVAVAQLMAESFAHAGVKTRAGQIAVALDAVLQEGDEAGKKT